MVETVNKVDQLAARLGVEWPALRKARQDAIEKKSELENLFQDRASSDASLVVFGSVARKELTSSSDLDWILLIDGQSVPEHKDQERSIEQNLKDRFVEPGKSGVFGKMVSSHELVHNIGGEDDLNSNTTRRVLLLLESIPIGSPEAYVRVRRQILRRYLEDDRGIRYGSGDDRIPRFLLNDFTRYWRTVTVDFVYKQRAEDRKWALRNAKLRMSRKLVFAAGLLHCFFCHLDASASAAIEALRKPDKDVSALIDYMEIQLSRTPLEVLAQACLELRVSPETARVVFDNYDRFLAILDDKEKREQLEKAVSHDDLRNSSAWREVQVVSHPFHDGMVKIFLNEDDRLKQLTMKYGVF